MAFIWKLKSNKNFLVMKTLRMIGMALFAVLMCVNFVSCNNEEVTSDEPNQEKYITVGLQCVGEYLDITESPLSRSTGNYTYSFHVYSGNSLYAKGEFQSLEGVTIKLQQDEKYTFKVGIIVDHISYANGVFNYSVAPNGLNAGIFSNHGTDYLTSESFYGELEDYTPEEGGNVTIDTKRVSYAAKFIAENLTEGTLNIDITFGYSLLSSTVNVSLTPDIPENDKIYSFYDYYNAWKGIYTQIGTDSETGEPTYGYKDYSCKKPLTISWKKDDGTVIPFGTYGVTFKRNVRTTIRINVAELPSVSNGITVTREDTSISDDENEYEISGGEIVEVPVSSEP